MMSEFTQRTGVEPTFEESHYIAESYYEFDGNKDEFCKAWLKDKRSGHWDKELRLRRMLDDQKAEYERKIAEQEETLEWYRPYFDRSRQFAKQLEEANGKLERLERVFRRVFDGQTV